MVVIIVLVLIAFSISGVISVLVCIVSTPVFGVIPVCRGSTVTGIVSVLILIPIIYIIAISVSMFVSIGLWIMLLA